MLNRDKLYRTDRYIYIYTMVNNRNNRKFLESSVYKIILFYKNSLFISDGAPVATDTVVHEVRKS